MLHMEGTVVKVVLKDNAKTKTVRILCDDEVYTVSVPLGYKIGDGESVDLPVSLRTYENRSYFVLKND